MYKFLFSHEILAKQFVDITTSYHIQSKLIVKQKSLEVHLDDDLDDLTLVQLNDYYADLSIQDLELSNPREIISKSSVITVEISLENGEITEVQLDEKILNKLTSSLNHDETHLLLSSIANAMQNQDDDLN